jgi:predicted nucleic acid-binding protein
VRLYGELFKKVRKKGRTLSHVDLVLAALASQFKVTILTADKDFQATPEIKTENWLIGYSRR